MILMALLGHLDWRLGTEGPHSDPADKTFNLTLIVLFISSNTFHFKLFCLVILFTIVFYVSLFGNKISITALLNVFYFRFSFIV